MNAAKTVKAEPRDPDLDKDVHALIRDVLPHLIHNPDEWMRTPNPTFGCLAPAEAIKEKRWAEVLRIMILGDKYGLFT